MLSVKCLVKPQWNITVWKMETGRRDYYGNWRWQTHYWIKLWRRKEMTEHSILTKSKLWYFVSKQQIYSANTTGQLQNPLNSCKWPHKPFQWCHCVITKLVPTIFSRAEKWKITLREIYLTHFQMYLWKRTETNYFVCITNSTLIILKISDSTREIIFNAPNQCQQCHGRLAYQYSPCLPWGYVSSSCDWHHCRLWQQQPTQINTTHIIAYTKGCWTFSPLRKFSKNYFFLSYSFTVST
jgi:hypothetical protein